jgi:hypothetical protein
VSFRKSPPERDTHSAQAVLSGAVAMTFLCNIDDSMYKSMQARAISFYRPISFSLPQPLPFSMASCPKLCVAYLPLSKFSPLSSPVYHPLFFPA